jgi:hypothetical protein
MPICCDAAWSRARVLRYTCGAAATGQLYDKDDTQFLLGSCQRVMEAQAATLGHAGGVTMLRTASTDESAGSDRLSSDWPTG